MQTRRPRRLPTLRPAALLAAALLPLAACGDSGPTSTSTEGGTSTTTDSGETSTSEGTTSATTGSATTTTTGTDATTTTTTTGAPIEGELVRRTVSMDAGGPAFVTVTDLEGDGHKDLLVSTFGVLGGLQIPNGEVVRFAGTGDIDQWQQLPFITVDAGIQFPNHTTVEDIDGDGDLDVIVPGGFLVCPAVPGNGDCGGIGWWEQDGGGWIRHDIVPFENELFYHGAVFVDFDGDGHKDLVTVGEKAAGTLIPSPPRVEAQWFPGTGAGFEPTPHVIGEGLGSFPRVLDVDGDGDLDVAGAEFFIEGGSFAWFERVGDPSPQNPAGLFVRRVIADDVGPSIMFDLVPDLFGDGALRAVGSNHSNTAKMPPDPWESAVYVFDIPGDPTTPWPRQAISQGIQSGPGSLIAPQAAPGIFGAGDIEGDGDIDIVVSGDGDPRVFWLEQTSPGVFLTRVIESGLGQAGGMVIDDLDDDGNADIVVTGYEDNVVYIYSWTPS